MTDVVIDYSGRPPGPLPAGYVGRSRYCSWQPNSKTLTPMEAQACWARGELLAAVWEVGANPLGSDPIAAGREFRRQMNVDGFPGNWPGYCAFDFDIGRELWAQSAGWLDRFWSAHGAVGGGYGPVEWEQQMFADHHTIASWVPYAWDQDDNTGTSLDEARQAGGALYQRLQTVTIDGTDCDVNDVLTANWLGWAPHRPAPNPIPSTWKVRPMFSPALQIIAWTPNKQHTGVYGLTPDGGLANSPGLPFVRGVNGKSFFVGHIAADICLPNETPPGARPPTFDESFTEVVVLDTNGYRYALPTDVQ